MSNVPSHIIETINTLLAPYGESYTPVVTTTAGGGYVNWAGAAKYTGLSKSTLRRAVQAGRLPNPRKVNAGRNGSTLFSLEQLDAFVRNCNDK